VPANASTPGPKRSNSGQPSAKRFSSAVGVIPADGFFEWAGPKGKRHPLWINPRAGGLLLFAGLYESWYPENERLELTFTVVTCAANALITAIHDRMPVVLDERAAEDWMTP
jgi:putative SOS response-associated peptidase YedK